MIYNAGSQPGTQREIAPTTVAEKEIRALDVATGIEKVFKLEHLQIVDQHCSAPLYDPKQSAVYESASEAVDSLTIGEAMQSYVARFEEMGWHVELSDDEIGLHSFFKNGKVKKTLEVRLAYFPTTVDSNGMKRESTRPYYFASKSFATAKAYKKLSKAIPRFLEEAMSRSPKNVK